jgi:polyisoprenoid-binding protein YceI
MNLVGIRRGALSATALFVFGVLLSASAAHRAPQAPAQRGAEEIVLAVDPAQSKVHWTLGGSLHTVHGTFALKRGTLRLEPASGKASGEIAADATSGESGNDSRDKKMHKEILESARYTEVVFRPDHVEGKVQAQGSSTVQVHGTFLLHGAEHELSVPVQADLTPDHWKGSAKFSVPYVQWGLKNPSNFLLKTDPSVGIELEMTGDVQSPKTP